MSLLKQAGFVYNADGSDYVDGSGEVRYAKVTEEQAKYYDSFNKVLADGTILMPATINWASSEGNAVSALLSTMLANSEATKAAGVSIVKTEMTFPEPAELHVSSGLLWPWRRLQHAHLQYVQPGYRLQRRCL